MEQELKVIDDCLATAGNIIKARLRKHEESLDSELKKLPIHSKYANRIIVTGTWHFEKLDQICKADLEATAQTIFETFEENFFGPNICSPNLNQKLKVEFSVHLNSHLECISELLKNFKNPSVDLIELQDRLISAYNSRIDLLCKKLAMDANKPQYAVMNKTEVTISGTANNVQFGNYNVQQIYSSIEAGIDARPGTPEQKAEAKSLLRKCMENPLVMAGLTEAVKTGVKGLLS